MTGNSEWEDVDSGWEDVPAEPKPQGAMEIIKHGIKAGLKETYKENVAPFVHAASLYAGDIPKAIAKSDKSEAGKIAYETLYPEQNTFEGKALRVATALPAMVMGSGGRMANAAGKVMMKAGSAFTKIMPQLAEKTILGGTARMAGTGAKLAAEGAAFGAGYVPEDGQDYANQIAGGAATNLVVPAAAKAIKSIRPTSKWAAGRLINSMIKPTKGQYAYGKNPGLEVAKTVGGANSYEELLAKTSAKQKEIGAKIGETIQAHNAMSKGKAEIDISEVVQPFEKAMDEAASQNNQTVLNRLNEAKNAILYNLERSEDKILKPQTIRPISNMPVEEAVALKQQIGKMTKWTGNPSDDKLINSALQDAYRVIKNKMNEAIPALKPLNESYGNLTSAKAAIENAVIRESKKESLGLGEKVLGGGVLLHGAISGDPKAIVEGFAYLGVAKALRHPAVRTRLAASLAKMSDIDKYKVFQKFPDLSKGVGTMAGKLKPIMTTEQYKTMLKNVHEKAKDLPQPGLSIKDVSGFTSHYGTPYKGEQDLTTKTLEKLKGRATVSKQFISDLTNQPDLKQAEREVIRQALNEFDDKVDVAQFANKVKTQLVPLEVRKGVMMGRSWEHINLPEELRGPVQNYDEHVYQSPIKTSAGDVHYEKKVYPKYFAHTRIEDLPGEATGKDPNFAKYSKGVDSRNMKKFSENTYAKGNTRRILEIQSDLFQKGNLQREIPFYKEGESATSMAAKAKEQKLTGRAIDRMKEISKLEPYENTWHERIIREEIKQAAKDGKAKLQFPTGKTAMQIEGLGTGKWSIAYDDGRVAELTPDKLKLGLTVKGHGEDPWIITKIGNDGSFKATPASNFEMIYDENFGGSLNRGEVVDKKIFDKVMSIIGDREMESFHLNQNFTDNPIYRFYEKDVAKYLKRIAPDMKQITDKQGVTWNQINVSKEAARKPIEAYAIAGAASASTLAVSNADAKEKRTVGQKNNNPINLKAFDNWDGMKGKDKYGHAIFKDMDHGIRAAIKNLNNHKNKNPNQTLLQYMNSFAEENGDKEAEFIAKTLGIKTSALLKDISMERLIIPMAKFESQIVLKPADIIRIKHKFKMR